MGGAEAPSFLPMSNFIYIPAEGERPGKWLNLAVLLKVVEHSDGALTIWNQADEEVGQFQNRQAAVLRLHLQGRAMSHQMSPELPAIPAAAQLESRLERRGVIQ